MNKPLLLILASALALGACNKGDGTAAGSEVGVDVAAMDKSVAPGDDFFTYANGNWVKRAEIPPTAAASAPSSRPGRRSSGRTLS